MGDRGREQVVNLHYMLSKAAVRARPSVLWCYKKELGFTTHRKSRMKQLKKKLKHGLVDADQVRTLVQWPCMSPAFPSIHIAWPALLCCRSACRRHQ
jgi:tRNA(Met) C34 N-acetyltransferase TmcA